MPTLNIEGRKIQVDDSFLQLPADQQQSTVDEIAAHFAPVDPLSVNDVARSAATGVPIIGGLLNKADAATNAALAPVLNPLFDAKDQLQGATFGDRYANSLAMQGGSDTKFATQHPYVDTGAKLAGGAAAMVPAMAAAPGLLGVTGGLASRATMGGLSNAALAGSDAAIRGQDPLAAAGFGGLLGAGLPVAGAAASGVASPFISYIMARLDPEAFGQRQVARAIVESGRPTADIAGDVVNAANEGQGAFNVADAIGNPGQRMLSTIARAPGQGRTDVVNALEGRQGTQGRRISNALSEGFGSRMTPAQLEEGMTAARGATADSEFGAVRNDAGPVDVTGAIAHIDDTLGPAADQMLSNTGSNTANDNVESALLGFRNRLARVNPDDFQSVQRIRGDMADAAQNARQSGYGNKARLITGAVRQLDTAMESASSGFRQANANFSQASRDIGAIQTGRDAAMRGRTEDAIPAFQALQPRGQQAFRTGYVDPLIADAQGAAFGANKARPLLNDAFQTEAGAMAPGNPLMQRRIGREQTMFETRAQALGGSRTADNFADADALGIDPSVVGHVISGNWGGAVKSLISAGSRTLTGNTPQVRQAVANILLRNGANLTGTQLDQMVGQTVAKIQAVQALARNSTRAVAGAVAVTLTTKKPRRLGRAN